MNSLNKVQLIGHTADEIKMHFFENEDCVGNVSIATNESYKDRDGEKVERTDWHNLVFRNNGAKAIEKYAPKGARLYVEGQLRTRKWTDQGGNDRYITEVHVREFLFLTPKNKQETAPEPGTGKFPASQEQTPKVEEKPQTIPSPVDDDLPF